MLDTFKIPKLKGSLDYHIWCIRITAINIERGLSNYIARNLAVSYNNIEQLEEDALKTTALINLYKGNLEEYINAFKRVVNNLEFRQIILPKKFITALLLNNLNKDYEYVVTIITQTVRTTDSEINLENINSRLLDESRRLKSIRENNNYCNNSNNHNYFNSKLRIIIVILKRILTIRMK